MSNLKQLNKHKNNKTKSEMKHKTLTFRFLDMSRGGFARLFLLLLLPCLSVIGVKAADSNGGVKFNSDVRYSQWAINSRLHDFYGNQKKFGFDYYDNNGNKTTPVVTWYKLDGKTEVTRSFDYVAGLVGKASLEAADFYKEFDWSKPWFYAAQGYATGTPYANPKMTLDNMNAAKMYFPILTGNLKSTDAETVATKAISDVIGHMKTYNSTYVIGSGANALNSTNANDVQKTMFGGWFHKSSDYTDQMWCDGQYMGPALLAQIIKHTGKTNNISDNDWDIIAKQFSITWAQLYDKTTGLLYHGFTANPGDAASKTWAGISKEKGIYHSASFWGRANAWYFLALVDILEVMPTDNDHYNTFKGYLTSLAEKIAKYQDKSTGCWYQVMDKVPASLTGNYLEASCSSIFTAGYLKAIRLGLLDKTTYEPIAKKAYEGLVNQFMVYDKTDNNTIQLVHSCTSAGLGGKDGRKGDDNYYLKGTDASVVTSSDPSSKYYYTEGKVLGGFIMAATEYERAYQNQDNKQILFARDLAPSYNFSTTPGTLDATAYGNGPVSYQWYKDGKAITDATSATFTPTVAGKYYCIATANGKSAGDNTIQTSTTTVTIANTDNGNTDNGGNDNGNTGDNTGTSDILSATVVAGKTLSIATKTSQELTADYITIKGGTATLYNGKGSNIDMITNTDGIKLNGSSASYMKITLDKPLAKGDVITATSTSDLYLTKDATKATDINLYNNPYTIPEGSSLIGTTEFYLWYGKFKAIKITRASTQVDLTASFTPTTLSATEGDASQNLPTLTVKAGETTLTTSDYTVTYASDNDAVAKVENGKVSIVGEGKTNIVATIKPNDTNKYKDASATFSVTVQKKQTPDTPTESEVIYNWGTSVGTTTDGKNCTSNTEVIIFGSNFNATEGKYITIKPKAGGFKAGDVITLKGYCNSKNLSGVIIYDDLKGNSIFKSNVLAKSTDGGSEFTFTLTQDCNALYLGRFGRGTTCLISLKVERPASSSNKTRLTASFEHNADVVVINTPSVTLPALTVKAGNNTLSDNQYKVEYKSNAADVATLNNDNTITIKSLGIATITATVTPKDANTYEGTTATYQLSVKAPSPLNVSVMDVTINTTDAEEEQPIIKVYGDNDKLLKLGQDYTLSFAVSGDNVTVDETTGKFSVTKNADKTAFIKGTSLITVTAIPTPSLGSNYTIGTLQFSYSVSEGKIKPVFLDSFKDITINLHQDDTSREIIVPLIYNGEDVSSYFKYTYKVTAKVNGQIQEFTENTLNYTPSTAGTYTVTVSATPGQNGEDNYGDVYDSPNPISFNLDINSTHQVIAVTPDPASIKMYAGTTQVAPDLTVTNGNATLADTEYNTSWFSTSPGVVKVDATTGKIEAVSEGTANIRVVVTGKNLESTTALIIVDVDDPAVYRVHANEEYKSQKTMWNQDENLFVTLGGWLFPNPVKDLWPTDESLSNTVEWNYDSTQKNYKARKAPWKITGFDYIVKAGDRQKNARQENGSNSMPETTLISNVDYTNKKYIVDPMFNVPCSGSFLTFQPKTNGTVVAHIYQNGVFDSKKKNDNTIDYQYRPQRRVFIMDEAGNFVSSDAHIESTTGKPNGKNYDLTQYKWDMGDKQSPTVETVKKHFGLESFEMSETGFKNNVYENQLDQTIAPNEAATKYPNLKGSRGWSVLADAPVTYTFKVKAGKTYYLYNFGSKIGFYGFSFDEDETKPVEDVVSYDDNTTNTIKTTEAGHVAKVTVNRKMTAGIWTTCVLPFSLNKHQVDAIFGNTYSIGNENGTQILYFDRVENGKVYFVRHAYNTIVANKPFLIKPSNDVESISTAAATEYPYVTIEATKNENGKPNDWCTGNGYTWASSYSNDMIVKAGDGFISNQDGTFKNFVGESGTLNGFRGYLKRLGNTQTGAKPMMLQVVNSSNVDGNNGETTGIEDLIIDADGQLMPANGKVYNINGQLVSEDANSFQSLPSGIYIINGKKYIK